jgi:hypothetical protein
MKTLRALLVLTSSIAVAASLAGQAAQQSQQSPLVYFGAEIGNQLDTTATGCYIGTAGTLVTDGTHDYILSNSHVLAREGAGAVGENIMHRVSTACDPGALHVGELAADVPLRFGRRSTNRVDAAVARITPNVLPGTDASGRILHIGNSFADAFGVTNAQVAASVGLPVKKSGRTTGLTRSSVGYTDVNVSVRYKAGIAYFTGQFVVLGAGFSAGGDSGSLIVTDDAAARPVGLLFAGSSTDTIGNPIDDVMSLLGAELGKTLSFGTSNDPGTFELTPPPGGGGGGGNGKGGGKPKGTARAAEVRDRHEAYLHGLRGVVGSGIGRANGAANITIFLERADPAVLASLPRQLEGVPVEVRVTGEFVAF